MVTDSWLSRSKSSEPKIAISEAFNFSMLFTFASRNLRKLNEFLVFRQKLFLLPKKKNLKLKNFTIRSKCFTSTDQKRKWTYHLNPIGSLVKFAAIKYQVKFNCLTMSVVMVKNFLGTLGSFLRPSLQIGILCCFKVNQVTCSRVNSNPEICGSNATIGKRILSL